MTAPIDFKKTPTVNGVPVAVTGHIHDTTPDHVHDNLYYRETEIDAMLAALGAAQHDHDALYAPLGHTHDSRYYTEAEIAALLAGYSPTGHNHDSVYGRLAAANTWGANQVVNGAVTAGTYSLMVAGAVGAARDIFLAGAAGYSNGFTVQYTGTEMRYQFLDGKLGVGITPLLRLHVHGNYADPAGSGITPAGLLAITNGDTYAGLYVGASTNAAANYPMWLQASGRNDLAVKYNLALQPLGGNVGVGTLNPQHRFHVVTAASEFAARNYRASWATNTTGGWARAWTLENENAGANPIAAFGAYGTAAGVGYTYLTITDKTVDETGYQQNLGIFLRSSGLVGIGTNNPQHSLEVYGSSAEIGVSKSVDVGSTRILFRNRASTPTKRSWHIATQYNVDDALEITRSTAAGGSTYSSPSAIFYNDGSVKFPGSVRVDNVFYAARGDSSVQSALSAGNMLGLTVEAFNNGNTVKYPIALAPWGGGVTIENGTNGPGEALTVGGNITFSRRLYSTYMGPYLNLGYTQWFGYIGLNTYTDDVGNFKQATTGYNGRSSGIRLAEDIGIFHAPSAGGVGNTTTPVWDLYIKYATGNVGIGTSEPQGRLHAWDGNGGMLHRSVTGVGSSEVELIPDGTGDVAGAIRINFVAVGSDNTKEASTITMTNGGFDASALGTYIIFTLYASGRLTVNRRSGTATYRISILAVWT